MGRHLLELGLKPGAAFGTILREAFDAQIEGVFFDLPQALRWLAAQEHLPLPPAARRTLVSVSPSSHAGRSTDSHP